jgi:hypothetical protein
MHTSHRFGVASTRTWLIGAAALATLVAAIFLLHSQATNAAPASSTVVSTAKTSLGRILVNSRGHTLYLFSKGPEREERVLRTVRDLLAAADRKRQAAGRGRREGVPDRNDQACRRPPPGDL